MRQKIMIWGTARCMSNILLRSFEARPDFKCISAPYAMAKYIGDERSGEIVKYFDHKEGFKYQDVEDSVRKCEDENPNKNILLKDHYYNFLGAPYDLEVIIPKGYKHGILYRNPIKALLSMKKLFLKINFELTLENFAEFVDYGKLYGVYEELIAKGIDENPSVINASFLANQPEAYLTEMCNLWELEYLPEMIDFPNTTTCLTDYPCADILNWRGDAIHSTTWRKETDYSESEFLSLPEDIHEFIQDQEVVYEKLNKICIRIGNK